MNTAETIREIMEQYNKARSAWIKKHGDNFREEEFHAWFTKQVKKGFAL